MSLWHNPLQVVTSMTATATSIKEKGLCDTDTRQTGWSKRVVTSWTQHWREQLHRWRSQQRDGMGRWDTGIGSLTDSSRWRGKRGGAEETGGTGASHAVETGAARQRVLQLMWVCVCDVCVFQRGAGGGGWRETGGVTRWNSKRKMEKKKQQNWQQMICPLTLVLPVWRGSEVSGGFQREAEVRH